MTIKERIKKYPKKYFELTLRAILLPLLLVIATLGYILLLPLIVIVEGELLDNIKEFKKLLRDIIKDEKRRWK